MTNRGKQVNSLISATTAALAEAPISGNWATALEMFAQAVGGWGCHLSSMSASKGLLASITGGISEDMVRGCVEAGGMDPQINLRAKAIYAAAPMRVGSEADPALASDWTASRYYNEFAKTIDAPYSAFAKLCSDYDETTCVIVLRSSSHGLATATEIGVFDQLLPSLQEALALQIALNRRSLRLAASSWDATDTAAYYCNPHMKILAMSHSGEQLAADGAIVEARRGRLHLVDEASQRRLSKAIAAAADYFSLGTAPWAFDAPSRDGKRCAHITVSPISSERRDMLMSPGALILVFERPRCPQDEDWRWVRLTSAEQDIARLLLEGKSTRSIAEQRGVSLLTIQTQIKTLNQRLNVRHRAELLARLRRIITN
jgi:DNA-binding CsgD family transcriptional regulator